MNKIFLVMMSAAFLLPAGSVQAADTGLNTATLNMKIFGIMNGTG